ncbi:hypothetical protein CFC21_026290 [Triticum aestivum]|uniref:Exocyst subunit Exo70 family protein n=2 Tax=Triticum aestivum TaxID=4565 RepID=A0A3B6CFW3_WHEAT|nr:hypothetical protein CFC21_026290 [Triticum aestivum]
MVSDGYLLLIFQSFIDSSFSQLVRYGGRCSLENWFAQLDVHWVLQMRDKYGWRFQFRDMSVSCLQELAERWTRALTVIVVSIKELVTAIHDVPAVAQFGRVSISPMLVFVDAAVHVNEAEKLQAMLHTYICLPNASYNMCMMHLISSEAQSIFNDIGASLDRERKRLIGAISNTMLVGWTLDILRGAGEVHRNTRLLVNCITLMRKAHASTKSSAHSHYTGELHDLIHDTVNYLKDLLLKKSALCSDPSLRYMFLLNNSNFIAQVSETSICLDVELCSGQQRRLELKNERNKYMDGYLDASWGHVVSCIPKSRSPGLIRGWINTRSLAKFESAFHETYQAQKLWKVPDPRLRDVLRRAIIERVIPGYRDYLKEHPLLEKQASDGSSSPEVLEEMLAELFEG